jgi:hypothetical protein
MALPLLALGGAAARAGLGAIARTTGAVAAKTGSAMRAGAAGAAGAGASAIGFSDVVKTGAEQSPANNVVNFKAANNAVGRSGRSSGGATAPITPTVTSTSSMSGDIAAASELSMEELANQTKVLKTIEKNTQKTAKNTTVPPSAGGQAKPPPSEEEIKERLDGEDDSKLAKLIGGLEKGITGGLGSAILALGAAIAVTRKPTPKKTGADRELGRLAGGGEELEGLAGALQNREGGQSLAKFTEIDRYRFKNDGTVGDVEQEANKAKQEQIAGMIDAAGGSDQDYQLLETAFREGNVKDIQSIEDKYREVGATASDAYQFRAADTKKFEFTAAMQVANREGIRTPGLFASDEEKQKFRNDMLAKQNEFAGRYSEAIGGVGANNFDRREALLGDTNLIGAGGGRLDDVIMSQFDEEKRGSMFGRSKEEDKAFDNIKAELEGYRKSLKSSGLGEREVNNKVADEIKKLEGMSANQMLEYTAPPQVSGAKLQGAQTSANEAADMKAARQSAPAPTPQTPAASQAGGEKDTITTGISVNNKAHDDTAKELKRLGSFFSFGF